MDCTDLLLTYPPAFDRTAFLPTATGYDISFESTIICSSSWWAVFNDFFMLLICNIHKNRTSKTIKTIWQFNRHCNVMILSTISAVQYLSCHAKNVLITWCLQVQGLHCTGLPQDQCSVEVLYRTAFAIIANTLPDTSYLWASGASEMLRKWDKHATSELLNAQHVLLSSLRRLVTHQTVSSLLSTSQCSMCDRQQPLVPSAQQSLTLYLSARLPLLLVSRDSAAEPHSQHTCQHIHYGYMTPVLFSIPVLIHLYYSIPVWQSIQPLLFREYWHCWMQQTWYNYTVHVLRTAWEVV